MSTPQVFVVRDFWQRSDVQQALIDFTNKRGLKFERLADTLRTLTGRYHTLTVVRREYETWLARHTALHTGRSFCHPDSIHILTAAKPPRIVRGGPPTSSEATSTFDTPGRSLMSMKEGTLTTATKKHTPASTELHTNLRKKRQAMTLRTSETFVEGSSMEPPVKRTALQSCAPDPDDQGHAAVVDDDLSLHHDKLADMPDSFNDIEPSADGRTVTMACQSTPLMRTLGTQTAQYSSPFALPERETSEMQYAVGRYRAEHGQITAVQYDGVYEEDEVGAEYMMNEEYEEEMYVDEQGHHVDDGDVQQVTHSSGGQSWIQHEAGAMGQIRKPQVYLESFGGVSMQNQRPLLYERIADDDYRPVFRKQNGGNRAHGIHAVETREGFAYYECVGCNSVITAMQRQCRNLFKCMRTRIGRNRLDIQHQTTCPCNGDPAPRRYKYHEPSSTVMWTHNEHIATCSPNSRADLVKQQVSRAMTKYVRDDGCEPQQAFDAAMEDGEHIARQFNVSWQVTASTMGRFDDHRRRLRTAQLRAHHTKMLEGQLPQDDEYAQLLGADGQPMVDAESGEPLRVYASHLVADGNVIYADDAQHVYGDDDEGHFAHDHVVIE